MSRRGALLFAGLCVVWGIPYFLIKVSVTDLSPAVLVLARTAIAAVALMPLALARGHLGATLRRWRPLLVFAAVEVAVPWLMLSDAERHLTSSLTGLLVAAVPLVGAGLALMRGRQDRLGRVNLVGLALGMLGVIALVGLDVHGSQTLAVLEVAVVALCYASGPVILNRWLSDLPGVGVMGVTVTVCALAYLPFGLATLPDRVPPARVLSAVVTLGLLCTAIAFLMLFGLVAEIGPVRATVITYVNPAVAVVAGVLLLHEPFTRATAAGFGLVVAGSVLATRKPGEPARTAPRLQVTAVADCD